MDTQVVQWAESGCIPLDITVKRCKNAHPLISIHSAPFEGLELRPNALIGLGQSLIAAAELANRLPTGGKHWRATRVFINSSGA